MGLFRCNIDRKMVNSGSVHKPFLYAEDETREYSFIRFRYCTVTTHKDMENINDDSRPWFVKVLELNTVRLFGIKLKDKEQHWKYDKFVSHE